MTHAERFQMFLTMAKSRFETAQLVASGMIRETNPQLTSSIIPALCDSFLFLCTRANRIARGASGDIDATGINAAQFQEFMADVSKTRNVAEHWGDVINPRKVKPHTHTSQIGLKIAVDETSYIVLGSEEIYSGSLNLYDAYVFVTMTLEQMAITSRLTSAPNVCAGNP
jgi:hypothetical protein